MRVNSRACALCSFLVGFGGSDEHVNVMRRRVGALSFPLRGGASAVSGGRLHLGSVAVAHAGAYDGIPQGAPPPFDHQELHSL